jgi:fatty acid desaturase
MRSLPVGHKQDDRSEGRVILMTTILWIIAVVLVVSGVFALIRKEMLWGAVLIIAGLLVGPGGVSIFS